MCTTRTQKIWLNHDKMKRNGEKMGRKITKNKPSALLSNRCSLPLEKCVVDVGFIERKNFIIIIVIYSDFSHRNYLTRTSHIFPPDGGEQEQKAKKSESGKMCERLFSSTRPPLCQLAISSPSIYYMHFLSVSSVFPLRLSYFPLVLCLTAGVLPWTICVSNIDTHTELLFLLL